MSTRPNLHLSALSATLLVLVVFAGACGAPSVPRVTPAAASTVVVPPVP